jgi:hypothetical protein
MIEHGGCCILQGSSITDGSTGSSPVSGGGGASGGRRSSARASGSYRSSASDSVCSRLGWEPYYPPSNGELDDKADWHAQEKKHKEWECKEQGERAAAAAGTRIAPPPPPAAHAPRRAATGGAIEGCHPNLVAVQGPHHACPAQQTTRQQYSRPPPSKWERCFDKFEDGCNELDTGVAILRSWYYFCVCKAARARWEVRRVVREWREESPWAGCLRAPGVVFE